LNGLRGIILVSQCAAKKMYQEWNPVEYVFIFKGWDYNLLLKGKSQYFIHDEE
jgi:hypothetical protein